jgi:hypothetical protein
MNAAKNEFLKSLLKPGELYAGILLGKDGEPDQHIIRLPGEAQSVDFDEAVKYAKDAGGRLPTRREQPLLFANLSETFTPNWYWSGEQRSAGSAWYQDFISGLQDWSYTDLKCRAVAVRSVAI